MAAGRLRIAAAAPKLPPMSSRPRVHTASPLFVVADLQRSLRFYREVLGFGEPSLHGEPPCFAMLCRDQIEIMLSVGEGDLAPTPNGPAGCWDVYLRVDDLAAELAALAAAGCAPAKGPTETFYRMREIELVDPDGYRWCVAEDISRTVETFAGELDLGSRRLPLVLRLFTADYGQHGGELDSPAQGAHGLPLASVARDAGRLRFAMPSIGAGYDGAFGDGGQAIAGTWTQGGGSWPLVWRRG